jgi:hypothetical protein
LRYQPTFEKIVKKAQEGFAIPSEDYLAATYFVVCHLYIGNPQGRIGALNELKLSDFDQLKSDGMVGSPHFKTVDTYGVQYISACNSTIQ